MFKSFINYIGQSDRRINVFSSISAIISGLLFGLIIMIITNPSEAPSAFITILTGGFQDGPQSMGKVLFYATPVIFTGLSVGFAFKTGLFNIGASGQLMIGAFIAVYVGIHWGFLPGHLHWIVALILAGVAGGLWAAIPGVLKAYRNVNEVVSTIMMNYIALYLVNFLVVKTVYNQLRNESFSVKENAVIPDVNGVYTMVAFFLISISIILYKLYKNKLHKKALGNDLNSSGVNRNASKYAGIISAIAIPGALAGLAGVVNGGFIIVVFVVVIIWIILNSTTVGYELKAVGFNRDASKYAGINEKRGIILAMAISGLLAGLAGGVIYLNNTDRHLEVLDVLVQEGFNGIPIALIGLSNPIGILFAGIFMGYIQQGGWAMQVYNIAPEIIDIIIASIIYFTALVILFKGFIIRFLKRYKEKEKQDLNEVNTNG